jgi:formylglycine-generating enzyme
MRGILISAALLLASLASLAGSREVHADGRALAYIASGWFSMGADRPDIDYAQRLCVSERMPSALRLRGCASEELFSNETPARRVFVSAYALDRHEVSRADYTECMLRGSCEPPLLETQHPGLSAPEHPIAGITWSQAEAYCRFRGGRLPTEAEWERAARGDSARRFPWGRAYNETFANHGAPALALEPLDGQPSGEDGVLHMAEVRAFQAAKSPHGLVQMAGNVWEWTADGYAPLSTQATRIDPKEPRGAGARVVRGGSFRSPAFSLRVTHREPRAEGAGFVDVGVRCAYGR